MAGGLVKCVAVDSLRGDASSSENIWPHLGEEVNDVYPVVLSVVSG